MEKHNHLLLKQSFKSVEAVADPSVTADWIYITTQSKWNVLKQVDQTQTSRAETIRCTPANAYVNHGYT